jgi:hypothetical protein
MLRNARNILKRVNFLVDLCSGRGNDLQRWNKLKIPYVTGFEISKEQYEESIKRLVGMKKRKIKMATKVSYVNVSVDNSLAVRRSLINPRTNKMRHPKLVTCNFALNYFFVSEKVHLFFKTVSTLLLPGGLFIGTATDGDVLMNMESQKNDRFTFEKMWDDKNDANEQLGRNYKFSLNSPYFKSIDEDDEKIIEEFIVQKEQLVKIAKMHGLVPVQLRSDVPAIFNFTEYPVSVNYWLKDGQKVFYPTENSTPVYYNRPDEISGLYFGFSFVKL